MAILNNTGRKKARPSTSPKLGDDLLRLYDYCAVNPAIMNQNGRALSYVLRLGLYLKGPEYERAKNARLAAKLKSTLKGKENTP